jgi:hypothetical protein
MLERIFIHKNWMANGFFAANISNIKIEFENLSNYLEQVKKAKKVNAKLTNIYQTESIPCYEFECEGLDNVLADQLYVDLITARKQERYHYKYAPKMSMVIIYNSNKKIIGIVMEVKRPGKW